MKYSLILDNNNYIISIYNSDHDEYELNLDSMDLEYLQAYKMIDNTPVLDEDVKQLLIIEKEKQTKLKRIKELEKLLNDTDYITARAFEKVLALSNPVTFIADFIKIIVKYSTEYKDIIADRITWRKEIEELKETN